VTALRAARHGHRQVVGLGLLRQEAIGSRAATENRHWYGGTRDTRMRNKTGNNARTSSSVAFVNGYDLRRREGRGQGPKRIEKVVIA
jgi:hypothetical protein